MKQGLRFCAYLAGIAALVFTFGTPAKAYYHYIHYLSRTGPFTPIFERFDVRALPDSTVSVFVSDVAPKTPGNDSFPSVLSQVRQAAAVWNSAGDSTLRLAFAGLEAKDQVSNTPGIDVVFTDEMAPGILAEAAPTVAKDPVVLADGTTFYPIVRSVVLLNSDTSLPPGPSYAETYFTTTVHELGHALGLQHTFTAGAMSQAIIRDTTRTRPLDADDIAALNVLYGKPGWNSAYGSISGKVTSNGQPVALASVVALPLNGPPVSALTAPDGTYRIDGIPSGNYMLYVQPLPPDADVRNPVDAGGAPFPASPVFGTLFYPGTRDSQQAANIPLRAGDAVTDQNFTVQPRSSVPIYDVVAFSYYDSANQTYSNVGTAVTPAFVNSMQLKTDGVATIVFWSTSMAPPPVPQSAAIPGLGAMQVWLCCSSQAVAVQFSMPNLISSVGPRHLILNYGNDIYIQPEAINLVLRNPPFLSSTAVNSDGTVTLTGSSLGTDSRVFFDGLEAAVKTPFNGDEDSGSVTVTPPPGFAGQKASIVVYNPDGQNTMTLDSVPLINGYAPRNPPPVYEYPAAAAPAITTALASLPAGANAKVEIAATNMSFVDGQVSVGFGSDDIVARRVWVLSPTRLVANVSVAPRAALGTSEISVISGFQVAAIPNGIQLLPVNANLPSIVQVENGVPTQATLYPGGYITLYGSNLNVAGAATRLALNDVSITPAYSSANQVNFAVPPGFPVGLATLRLNNGTDDSLPLAVELSSPPPAIVSVGLVVGALLDADHPAGSGDALSIRVTGLDPATDPSRIRVTVGGADVPATLISAAQNGVVEVQVILGDQPGGARTPVAVWVDGSASAPLFIPVRQSGV